jgi:hypothetical protein
LRATASADSYSNAYSHTHGYAYANCDAMHGQMYTDAQASPDPGAATIARQKRA